MDCNPLISIVLPVWNGENYLGEALDSILKQTHKNFELIVVDDCSTDSSLSIAQCYADGDSRIKIITNEVNLRLPASLNRGFSIAVGEYFTWTSDDNILEPGFLQVLLKDLLETGADLIYSNFNSIDEAGSFIGLSPVGEAERLVSQNTIGASFLYKREVHDLIGGYDVKKFLFEDYDFWVRAYLFGFKFKKNTNVLYNYRRHSGALTSTRSMPKDYPLYRFELRKKFQGISRGAAYEAREILLGYRRELGFSKTLQVLVEALMLRPDKVFIYIGSGLKKLWDRNRRRSKSIDHSW